MPRKSFHMFPPLRLVALALVLLLVVNIIFQYERLSEHDGGWDTEPRLSNWRDWAWGSLLAPYRLEPEESLPLDWMPPDPTRIPNGRGKTVCFVTAEFEGHAPLGGIGTAFTDLARILAGRGWNVTILIALPLQEVGTSAWIHTLNIVHLDVVPRVWISPNTVSISRGMQVLEFLQENPFDIVHFHDYLGIGYYSLLAKRQGWAFQDTTFVVGLHGPSSWANHLSKRYPESPEELAVYYAEQREVELADVVVSPSSYMLRYVQRRGWSLPPATYVIKNVISQRFLEEASRRQADQALRVLVFFGRLEPRKGVELLLDALERLARRNATGTLHTVAFLGADLRTPEHGSMLRYIRDRHRTAGWSHLQIEFRRFKRNEIPYWLRRSDIMVVIPSLNENSPYTVLESLALGVPFIASDSGGIPELVHPEDRARVLFRPTPRHLADKLEYAIAHYEEWGRAAARFAVPPSAILSAWTNLHFQLSFPYPPRAPAAAAAAAAPEPLQARVSVCVIHHDRPRYLPQLLRALANQTYPRQLLDIILYDDGSQSAEALAALNGTLRRDVEALGGRVVLAAQNVYLGAARNRCARLSRGDYLFFLDDDDLPKPHMLERMLRVALRTRADFVACHYDVFASEVSPLEEPEAVTRRHVYAFLGPAASLALAENCIGGAAMLVRRAAFERLGGFSEYTDVGGEDYELLVRALLQGLAIELVPEPLVFVRDTPDSMAKTMLLPLVRYRALVPYLNHYPLLVDALLLARGLADRLARAHDGRRRLIADSRLDFSSQQGQFGWWYGFVEEREQEQKDTSEAETAAVAAAEMTILSRESPTQFAFFDAREGRWRYARSPYGWPYIERDNMHPYANGSLQIHPLRRLVLPCGGNFSLFLDLQKDPTRDCGDGVTWRVLLDGRELWRQEATEGTRLEEELRFEAPISSRLDLLVQAHQYDVCDLTGVHMRLFLLLPS